MTTHALDDELQALLDGEIEGPVAAGLRDHLEACGECARVFERLRETADCFTLAVVAVDSVEPGRWNDDGSSRESNRSAATGGVHGVPASDAPARRMTALRISLLASPGPIRWAAGLTLLVAGAASAALVLGVPFLPGREAGTPAPTPEMVATVNAGAAVGVQPLDGAVEVLLVDVGPGSALQLYYGEERDVLVDVAGNGPSRFEVRDGSVSANLAGVTARITVVVPHAVEEVLVRVGDREVARAGGGAVSPAEATGPEGWMLVGPP